MKLNTLFVAGVCATALFASCSPQTAKENQLKYTHTSLADGDAYQFFQIVGGKAAYEADYAAYAEKAATSAQVKQLAAKVKEVYGTLIPTMDTLATAFQVDFPIRGALKYGASEKTTTPVDTAAHTADSTAVVATVAPHVHGTAAFSDEAYTHHVQHEAAAIKDQFERLTRNTNGKFRDFAVANVEKVAELFKLAGGKEEGHAHH